MEATKKDMLSGLDGKIDWSYDHHGFGRGAQWDVRRWRKWEIRQLGFHDLLDYFAHIQHQEWGYTHGLYSIKELAKEVWGDLQWRQAQYRPAEYEKNELYMVNYAKGWTPVWTGSDHYRGFYDNFRVARHIMMIKELGDGAYWIKQAWRDHRVWSDEAAERNLYLVDTERATKAFAKTLGVDSPALRLYLGDVLAVEYLEQRGRLSRDERIIHYHGEITLDELFGRIRTR